MTATLFFTNHTSNLTFIQHPLGVYPPVSKEGDMFGGVEREIGEMLTMGLLIKVMCNQSGAIYFYTYKTNIPTPFIEKCLKTNNPTYIINSVTHLYLY